MIYENHSKGKAITTIRMKATTRFTVRGRKSGIPLGGGLGLQALQRVAPLQFRHQR